MLTKHFGHALIKMRIASGLDRVLLYEFDILKDHQTFAKQSLQVMEKALETKIHEVTKNMNDDQRQEYIENRYDQVVDVTESLPRIQWYAQFLIVYSTFEHILNELCSIVKQRSGFSLSTSDLSGKGITKAKNYLSKVAGVKTPFETNDWQRAMLLGEIRNAIAHKNGEIVVDQNTQKSLYYRLQNEDFLKLHNSFEGSENTKIILNAEFVLTAIISIQKVIIDISDYKLYKIEVQKMD